MDFPPRGPLTSIYGPATLGLLTASLVRRPTIGLNTCRQVSGESVEDYKQNVRDGLRRLLDPPVDPLGGPAEWIIVYVRPSTIDAQSKGPSKASLPATDT